MNADIVINVTPMIAISYNTVCICRKKWADQFYYDLKTEKVHIGVSEEHKDDAIKGMDKYQNKTGFENYEVENYEEGRFHCTALLHIGQKLSSATKCFLLSGTVIDEKTGITVAHGFQYDHENVFDASGSAAEVVPEIIGKCRERIDKKSLQSGQITADLAIIDLKPEVGLGKNTVPWPNIQNVMKEFRVKIYQGEPIPDNKQVMILDQDGDYCYGAIRRHSFNDRLAEVQYYNVLAVSCDSEAEMREKAITKRGDSGALVMSRPEDNADVLLVYGIVIARYDYKDKDTSLTIANSLGEVVRNVDSLRLQASTQFPNCATDDVIDFTWIDP